MEYNYPQENVYIISSKVAYLIGVPSSIFRNQYESPDLTIFEELEQDKNARIIRNLCRIRTAFMRRFQNIQRAMQFDLKNIHSLPEYIPTESVMQLEKDGVQIIHANCPAEKYMILLNHKITNHIDACRELFPIWVNWNYIRALFVLPKGQTVAGNKSASYRYHMHIQWYPYQQFINWKPVDCGNLLYNDKKFIFVLYQSHNDFFQDVSNVLDAGQSVKEQICAYLEDSEHTLLAVDCENSDPYKIHSMLYALPPDARSKISKILLFDDEHTSPAWKFLEEFTTIPVEHMIVSRVKQDKSRVDGYFMVAICRQFYQNNADSFLICSSDSDYYNLVDQLPESRYLFCVEEQKCSPKMMQTLQKQEVYYCLLDDFCTGINDKIKTRVLTKQIQSCLDLHKFNINDILKEVYMESRMELSPTEKRQFFEQHVKPMRLTIESDGTVSIQIV